MILHQNWSKTVKLLVIIPQAVLALGWEKCWGKWQNVYIVKSGSYWKTLWTFFATLQSYTKDLLAVIVDSSKSPVEDACHLGQVWHHWYHLGDHSIQTIVKIFFPVYFFSYIYFLEFFDLFQCVIFIFVFETYG